MDNFTEIDKILEEGGISRDRGDMFKEAVRGGDRGEASYQASYISMQLHGNAPDGETSAIQERWNDVVTNPLSQGNKKSDILAYQPIENNAA